MSPPVPALVEMQVVGEMRDKSDSRSCENKRNTCEARTHRNTRAFPVLIHRTRFDTVPPDARSAMKRRLLLTVAILSVGLGLSAADTKQADRDALWAAVRNSDTKAIKSALDKGADVNAKNEIGVTALWIAASKGKLE